eukprot:3690282-Pleurochrysis_carterae.AAC.1
MPRPRRFCGRRPAQIHKCTKGQAVQPFLVPVALISGTIVYQLICSNSAPGATRAQSPARRRLSAARSSACGTLQRVRHAPA